MPTKPSLARDLFEQIKTHAGHADSAAFLRAMADPASPTFETEYLDFKAGQIPVNNNPIPDADVKKTWTEALAGFATTSGGVLIWGINADKDAATGVDAANAVLPV